jgi:ubiquitin carboxyl-terminal hydrolase 7
LTRPGGKEWWMRFDDEKVYFVSSSSAFEDSYGGRYAVCDDYFETTKDSRYASTLDMSVRLYSAYILFYVHVDQAKELLQEPDANEVIDFKSIEWICKIRVF